MDDPAQMSDDELKTAIGQPEETKEEAPVASPSESKQEEQAEPLKEEVEAPAEEAPAEPESEETPVAPSRREQLRVQQLLAKYGPPPETAQPPKGKDYRELLTAEDEGLYETLESDRQAAQKSAYQEGLEQAKTDNWRHYLRLEERQIWANHPELDPSNKESFHQALAESMQSKYLRFVGFDPQSNTVRNPDVSYLDFVDAELEFADELASIKVAKTTQNIAKQAAQTGLRPDGSGARGLDLNKAPEDMTNEELEAAINASMPRDSRGRFTKTK